MENKKFGKLKFKNVWNLWRNSMVDLIAFSLQRSSLFSIGLHIIREQEGGE